MGIQVLRANKGKPAVSTAPPEEALPGPRSAAPGGPRTPRIHRASRTAYYDRSKFVYVLAHSKPLVTRVYRIFGLRRGTMMIAIHDLLWSSFVVFLLVLATAHSHEVYRIVEGDVQDQAQLVDTDQQQQQQQHHHQHMDLEERSYYLRLMEATFAQGRDYSLTNNHHDNEMKLHNGLHVATVMTMAMVLGISMAGIDMIASMMLLAGAMLHVRQLMMPWLSLRLIEMLLLIGFSAVSLFYYARGLLLIKVFFVTCLVLCVVFYHWLVAYSLHEHLCRMERTGIITHHTRPGHAAAAAAAAANGGSVSANPLSACHCPRETQELVGVGTMGQAVFPADGKVVLALPILRDLRVTPCPEPKGRIVLTAPDSPVSPDDCLHLPCDYPTPTEKEELPDV